MKTYHTEQRQRLLGFLHTHAAQSFTVEELTAALKGELAQSTVYRLMSRLVAEGAVRRVAKDGSRRFVYQALACEACHSHLHMQCTTCGRLIHLDENTSHAVREMLGTTDFVVDEGKTVLLGHCKACAKGAETR